MEIVPNNSIVVRWLESELDPLSTLDLLIRRAALLTVIRPVVACS